MVEIMYIQFLKFFVFFSFSLFFSNILVEYVFEGHLGNLLNLKFLVVSIVVSVFCSLIGVYAKKRMLNKK